MTFTFILHYQKYIHIYTRMSDISPLLRSGYSFTVIAQMKTDSYILRYNCLSRSISCNVNS